MHSRMMDVYASVVKPWVDAGLFLVTASAMVAKRMAGMQIASATSNAASLESITVPRIAD